jgi:hypothetical protein
MGAKIRAEGARKRAAEAGREADRAEAEAWSIQMEGYGGPAQPSPTTGQCLNGGLGWLEVECKRCKTRASLPLDAIRRPRDTPIWKFALLAPGSHDQTHTTARAFVLPLGASRRGAVSPQVRARRALLWRVQFALKPASKALGLHGVFIRGKGLKYLIADSAFIRMEVDAPGACWLDADEHHLGLAPRTGRALNCSEWNDGRQTLRWGHDASLEQAGAQHSLSPVMPRRRSGDRVIMRRQGLKRELIRGYAEGKVGTRRPVRARGFLNQRPVSSLGSVLDISTRPRRRCTALRPR